MTVSRCAGQLEYEDEACVTERFAAMLREMV